MEKIKSADPKIGPDMLLFTLECKKIAEGKIGSD